MEMLSHFLVEWFVTSFQMFFYGYIDQMCTSMSICKIFLIN